MKVGYLQFKPEFGKPEINSVRIEEFIRNKDFHLLVLPELANSGYFFSSFTELEGASEEIPGGIFCNTLQKISAEHNAYIVSGVCERAGERYYNSSVLVYPSGEIKVYRKIHLFYEEKKWFTPGDYALEPYEICADDKPVKVGMMICFDWIFPETARTLALKGAQIICHPSNLVLPYCQQAMYTRAVENRIFTITANRTGSETNASSTLNFTGTSVILDPKGNYLARGSENNDECTVVEINPDESMNKNVTELNNIFEDRRTELYY